MAEKPTFAYHAWSLILMAAALAALLGTSSLSYSATPPAERLAIYKLDPKTEISAKDADLTNAKVFHGSVIFRRVIVRDAELGKRLHSLVHDAVASGTAPSVREGDVGVRFLDRKDPDVIICFYCRPVRFRVSTKSIDSDRQIFVPSDKSHDIECLLTLVQK
jgi:hypothetical protein